MSTPIRPAFTEIDGLPPEDDSEITALMEEAVDYMTPAEHREFIRSLLRAATAWHRTGNTDYLTSLAHNALVTTGYRRDPEVRAALARAPREAAGLGHAVDVEKMLQDLGL